MDRKTLLTGVLIAGAVGVAQVLVSFDAATITDWRTWAVGLVGAFVRPAAAHFVAKWATS